MTNVDDTYATDTISKMKRQITLRTVTACVMALGLLVFGACSTPETRISERPDVYRSLSSTDQALVSQGKIREGMSRDAVYIAWGAPNQRAAGRNRGNSVETWIYYNTTTDYHPGGFGYGLGYGGYGGYVGSAVHRHRGGRLHRHYYYDPFYDPFFWSRNRLISYPERTVSFQGGRVIAYQLLPAPRVF